MTTPLITTMALYGLLRVIAGARIGAWLIRRDARAVMEHVERDITAALEALDRTPAGVKDCKIKLIMTLTRIRFRRR